MRRKGDKNDGNSKEEEQFQVRVIMNFYYSIFLCLKKIKILSFYIRKVHRFRKSY